MITISRELTAPCGHPIELAEGNGIGWIDAPETVSAGTIDVSRGGTYTSPLVPAGKVRVLPPRALEGGESAVLIGLTAAEGGSSFQRPVPPGAVAAAHAVPAGSVIAAIVDAKGNAVAISKPKRVRAGETVDLAPLRNTEAADLLAILSRPQAGREERVRVSASGGGAERAPDAFVAAADAMVAVWYGVTARNVRLVLDSKLVRLPADSVDLARTGVTTVRETLRMLPTLTVAIGALPASIRRGDLPPLALTVLKDRDEVPVVPRTEAAPGRAYTFEHLPLFRGVVMLEIGAFKTGERIDLTTGDDARVDLALEPVPISGTVFAGEVPARAELRFLQKGDPVKTATDERGRYSITLWEERRYFVDVQLLDRPSTPPLQEVISVAANTTIDFHVPAMRFAARVFDAETNKPLASTIALRNAWTAADGPHAGVRAFTSSADSPVTELPPQQPGTSELRVSAPGYLDSGPIVVPIDPAVPEKIVDVPMRPAGATTAFEFRLPGGLAAAGAEVTISPDGNAVAWRATADDGRIEIPKSFSGMLLLVRHASAGSAVFRLALDEPPPYVRQLPPPAPSLTVTVAPHDESRTANAIVAWIGGTRLSGAALAFLTSSSGLSDRERQWVARNLPPEPLRVLAAGSAKLSQAIGGAYDAVATTVPYPWPPRVIVEPVN